MARLSQSRWSHLAAFVLLASVVPMLLLAANLLHHVYYDRSNLPDLEAFLRFEPHGIGEITDERGTVLIQLAREYRRVVSYEEVPPILRDAVLAAEDRSFLTHSGVEYRSLPRVAWKSAGYSLASWRNGEGFRPRFPQGGSTITQQLVRGYFLADLVARENGDLPIGEGLSMGVLSRVLGVRAGNKLARKMEEVRLTLWLEEEMARRYGSQERAKREIFARYASYIYLGHGRYGFAAASEYYFGESLSGYTTDDAARAALLAGISKSPGVYGPLSADERPVLRRRNEILTLMERNGSISAHLGERSRAEPIHLAARNPVKTEAPAAIGNVLEELSQVGASAFGIEELFQGRIAVRSTLDARAQAIVNEALENGLSQYESRHPKAKGVIQGSVVILRNADAAILAESGGRQIFEGRSARYSDLNRVTGSLRQTGSAWKPLVYLAAMRRGLELDTPVLDDPIEVPLGGINDGFKWIANYDSEFKGPIPARQALAESRNAVAIWIAREVGIDEVNRIARQMGIRTRLPGYISTALGASEIRLLELADVYRVMASGILAEPHVIARVTETSSGAVLYEASPSRIGEHGPSRAELSLIQEGLRGVVRLPGGTANALNRSDFPIPVMGKTGTTNDFRDALFIGSTYGRGGITVAVRVGFDDNRSLGSRETGSRVALPIFREIMLRIYQDRLVGPPPRFPSEIEASIDRYLAEQVATQVASQRLVAAVYQDEYPDEAGRVLPHGDDLARAVAWIPAPSRVVNDP